MIQAQQRTHRGELARDDYNGCQTLTYQFTNSCLAATLTHPLGDWLVTVAIGGKWPIHQFPLAARSTYPPTRAFAT